MRARAATYLPIWGSSNDSREPGTDEDSVTMAVAAAQQLGELSDVRDVVFISRTPPLLEGGNAASLLGGLGLPSNTSVTEVVGGSPATLDAMGNAQAGTLVVGADTASGSAGAGAFVLLSDVNPVAVAGRVHRSLPVRTRDVDGVVHDDPDPRLLRERGTMPAIDSLCGATPPVALVGVSARDARQFAAGKPPVVPPTTGASAPMFAIASLVEAGTSGMIVGLEQASGTAVEFDATDVQSFRGERPCAAAPPRSMAFDADIKIALTAYERAFDSKLRWEAGECRACGTLAFPSRRRCLECGDENHKLPQPLPRTGTVYSGTTIRVPVPGLATPYSLAIVQLDDSPVRVLATVSDAPDAVDIDDSGALVFRRVATRSGIPDYGYAFVPQASATERRDLP